MFQSGVSSRQSSQGIANKAMVGAHTAGDSGSWWLKVIGNCTWKSEGLIRRLGPGEWVEFRWGKNNCSVQYVREHKTGQHTFNAFSQQFYSLPFQQHRDVLGSARTVRPAGMYWSRTVQTLGLCRGDAKRLTLVTLLLISVRNIRHDTVW